MGETVDVTVDRTLIGTAGKTVRRTVFVTVMKTVSGTVVLTGSPTVTGTVGVLILGLKTTVLGSLLITVRFAIHVTVLPTVAPRFPRAMARTVVKHSVFTGRCMAGPVDRRATQHLINPSLEFSQQRHGSASRIAQTSGSQGA